MAEVVAAISLAAAILQLLKYGREITTKMSNLRSVSHSMQHWEMQIHLSLSLIETIRARPLIVDDHIRQCLCHYEKEFIAVNSILEELMLRTMQPRFSQLRNQIKLLWKEREINRRIYELRKLRSDLYQNFIL
jgi:hypothetical protein